MFKLHKPHLASTSNIIHSGHFMVSRYDDDEDDQNDAGDDSSESERDNGQNYEIDVSNPDAVADATKSLDINYQVQSPSAKNELVTSWNDLDRPPAKRPHQYLTYYTNKSSSSSTGGGKVGGQSKPNGQVVNGDDDLGGQRRKVLATGSGCSTSPTASVALVKSNGDDLDELSAGPVDATIEGRASLMRQPTSNASANTSTRTTTLTAANQLADHATTSLHLVASAASAAASIERAAISTMITSIDAYYDDDDANNEPHDLRGGDLAAIQTRHQTIVHQGQLQNNLQVQQAYQNQHADSQKHALTIDASLTKLLESMSLYYSSKLTSPKWKSFKGLKLRMKHKIRLNNLIWRAWFLQCIRGREPPGCQFTAPAETDVHKKSETIVLEGKYWKRKEKAIVDEYKKWRIFHKQRSQIAMCQMHCFRPSSFDWDTRVSNWASSSSVYGAELSFYPDDYDANLNYNLDELNPMSSQLEPDAYYQPNPISQVPNMGTRMIEAPQQHQTMSTTTTTTIQTIPQQQSAQFLAQPQVPSRIQENPTNPHNQIQNQAHLQQQQQQSSQPQLQQHHHHLQHHQVLSLKADRSTPVQQYSSDQMHQLGPPQAINISLPNFAHHHHHQQQQQQQTQNHLQQQHSQQHSNFHQHQLHHQQMQHNSHLQQQQLHHHQQQQQQQQQMQQQQLVPFAFENNAVYQQIQQQQQQKQPHQLNQAHQQQMHQQQLQDQPDSYSNNQDFCSLSSGASSIVSGMEGGRTEELRRVCHINAEQKRRCNIKNGFETLKSILPSVSPNTNVKISKASMLQKAAAYISSLTAEQKQQLEEQAILRQQVDSLKQAILAQQAQLPPVSGVLVGPTSNSAATIRAREMLQDYVRKRTNENWKFWIFSLMIEPLYESYHRAVNTNTLEEAFKTIYGWLDQSVGLSSLRKDATESLTVLSTNTNVLTSPQTLPTEAVEAVRYPSNLQQHSTSSSSSSTTSANRSMQILPDLTGTSQTCYSEATF